MGKFAIVLVSTLIVFIFSYTLALKNVYLEADSRTANAYSYNQANNIAQSTLMAAIRELGQDQHNYDLPQPGDEPFVRQSEVNNLNGAYNLEVHTLEVLGDDEYRVRFVATGIFEDREYTSEVTGIFFDNPTGPPPPPLWDIGDYAAFGDEGVTLGGAPGQGGHPDMDFVVGPVGTNHNVTLNAEHANVNGAVVVGSGHSGDADGGIVNNTNLENDAIVSEGIGSHQDQVELELPDFSEYDYDAIGAQPLAITGNSGNLNPGSGNRFHIEGSTTIQSNERVNINVPASYDEGDDIYLYFDALTLNTGHLDFNFLGPEDNRPTIHMHVDNYSNLNEHSSNSINAGGDANNLIFYDMKSTNLRFMGSGEYNMGIVAKQANIEIRGSGGVSGSVITGGSSVIIEGSGHANSQLFYAPNADIELLGSGSFRGSLIGKSVMIDGGHTENQAEGRIVFDPDFAGLPEIGNPGGDESNDLLFTIERWQ